MPLYDYWCQQCGYKFEEIQKWEHRDMVNCHKCGARVTCKMSVPAKVTITRPEQLPYGNKSRGKYVSSEETGGLGILVPSFGALEKEEVEYTALEATEKEKDRVRKGKQFVNEQKSLIQKYMDVAYKTKPRKRIEAMRKLAREEGQKLNSG